MSSSESRAERLRRVHRHKAIQAELAKQKEDDDFAAMRAAKVKAAAVDEALAAELAEQQRLEMKDAKMLQLVREYPDVRALETQLKDAYLRKNRAEQVTDHSIAKARAVEEQRQYMSFLAEQDRLAKEEDEKKRLEDMERFRRHQAEQLEIIRQRRAATLDEAKQRDQERIAVDAVAARVHEQDFLENLSRRDRQRRLLEEQNEFVRLRAAIKKAEQDREAKEEAAIRAYFEEQNRRRKIDEKTARERDAVKARILEDQSRRIAEEERKKRELEVLLQEYYEEERLAKERMLIKAEQESRERMAAAVLRENENLIEQRRLAKETEMAEMMRARQEAMEKLAEQAKLDQLNRQKQAQLKRQHIAEVNQRLEQRRLLKEKEKELERKVTEQDVQHELQIQEYIRRARAQLLEEHLPKLGMYAPVHAMRAEEKLKFLPQAKASGQASLPR